MSLFQKFLKRVFDIAAAICGLTALSPLLLVIAALIWLEDRGSPWYRGSRMARGARFSDGRWQPGSEFRMLKFRSMYTDAWKTGVNSTSANDRRITRCGHFLRRFKLDELPQLWNVLIGEMSLVGPRPQVPADAALYTAVERAMLAVRPGITDLASIVFADEGDILTGAEDPDLLYNQIIRPWKSRLALLYIGHASLAADLQILGLTALALVSREGALAGVQSLLKRWDTDVLLRKLALRQEPLPAFPPPGADKIVEHYNALQAETQAAAKSAAAM